MSTAQPEFAPAILEDTSEIKEGTLDFMVRGVLIARDNKLQADAEFSRMLDKARPLLSRLDPEDVADQEIKEGLTEIQLLIKGPGGA